MSGLATLIKVAERRTEEALLAWQRLRAQCDDARQKLLLLQKHGEGYRDLMRAGLRLSLPSAAIMAHIGFIEQIEVVVARQSGEIGNLEEACSRQWQRLVQFRREKRIYEILGERIAARDAATAARHRQAEIDELLQRAARTLAPNLRSPELDEERELR
jgi:flagellar export protein FliJ